MARVNPIQVQKYLKGLNYPVGKDDLINKAKEEGADENIMSTLRDLPDKEYNSPISVTREIGKLE